MYEKLINNTEELNAMAVHLRNSQNFSELKVLAAQWLVPKQDVEDFIKGKRFQLAEIPLSEKEYTSAVEKLREEMWHMKDQLGERDANPARWDAHTVMTAVDSLRNGELAIIMDCGYDDLFYGVNLKLHEKLLDKKIDHDFLVRPGGHNEAYWAVSLPYQLLFFQRWFDAHRR